MNPSDALPQDYGMYYDGCWMKHTSLGIGRVRVVNGKMYFEKNPGQDEPKIVRSKYLTCWWPRAGAFNIVGKHKAVFIARRAMRNMRKSAISGDHYFTKWGSPTCRIMETLREGPNLLPLQEAIDLLKKPEWISVAVARDIILTNGEIPDESIVIFRGEESGTYKYGCYTPMFSDNPLTGRILRQLEVR